VPGKIGKVVEAMGGVPVTTLGAEIYGAMETGLLEGSYLSIVDIDTYKVGELATWGLDTGSGLYHNTQTVMNIDTLNSMPPEVKEIMLSKEAELYAIDWYMSYQNRTERAVVTKLAAGGIEWYRMSDAEIEKCRVVAERVWDEVIASKSDPELAKRFWNRYLELYPKYDEETRYSGPEL